MAEIQKLSKDITIVNVPVGDDTLSIVINKKSDMITAQMKNRFFTHTIEVGDYVVLHYDEKSEGVVGFTVLFLQKFMKELVNITKMEDQNV